MQLILIIPIAIILSTIAIFFILSKALSSYIHKMENKTKTIQRISLLLIASDFVSLFSSSESKNLVDNIVQGRGQDDEHIFESLSSSFGGAGYEIERLYTEINRAYRPSEELSKIKTSAMYLRIILLFYGLSVSISQFVIVTFFTKFRPDLFSPATSGMLIATVLFSSIFLYISVYISYLSRRIEIRYTKLQNKRVKGQHETD